MFKNIIKLGQKSMPVTVHEGGWVSKLQRAILLWQHSGFESRHPSKIIHERHQRRNGQKISKKIDHEFMSKLLKSKVQLSFHSYTKKWRHGQDVYCEIEVHYMQKKYQNCFLINCVSMRYIIRFCRLNRNPLFMIKRNMQI